MSKATVLIVEDDGVVAMDIEDELNSRGWLVLGAVGSERRALAVIEKTLPDLAVLDINLRGRKSFELALALRSKGVCVVFVSGNSVADLPKDLKDCPFIHKPVQYDVLDDTLRKVWGNTMP